MAATDRWVGISSRMEIRSLTTGLSAKKGAVITFQRGKTERHSFPDMATDVARVRRALVEWGVRPGMRVGIYAPNSYAWLIHDLALIDAGAISVPFTDDFAGQVNDELLARYDVALLLIAKCHARLFPQKQPHIAFIDAENGEIRALDRMPQPQGDEADQHSLVFSSGSAGGLKGLVISRKGLEATLPPIYSAVGISPNDCLLLFLPLSNLQQRNMCYAAITYDFDLIITDFTQLFAAMQALNPTLLIAPPVLYQMVYAEFEKQPAWKRKPRIALAKAASLIPIPAVRRAAIRALFGDVLSQFGNRMRLLLTGMAPIRRNIGEFFDLLQLPLCESYGMVEAGSITYRGRDSRAFGSVGKVLNGIKLAFEPDGEIIVERDAHLTLRYFQCAEGENERTFLSPTRVATGDIGRLDADGNLYLMGRKKELIVAPNGYKIHPEAIEHELNHCPEVEQSVVFLKPHAANLTCVVVLNQPETDGARDRVKKYVSGLQSTKKAGQFVDVKFAEEPFTRENGMLRPNMKIDRKRIAAKYSD